MQFLVPGFARDGVDAADADLHRVRPPGGSLETQPECLALKQRDEDAAVLQPGAWNTLLKVLDAQHRERSQAWRQWVSAAIVRQTQRALQGDGQPGPETESIPVNGGRKHTGSPVSAAR